MPAISQFNSDPFLQNLLQRHINWHMRDRRILMGNPGSGIEFLQYHQNIIVDFFRWNNSQRNPYPLQSIAPWDNIPPSLKNTTFWSAQWRDDEIRLTNNLRSFRSEDELGIFIERGIHNFLHQATAQVAVEHVLAGLESPRSTYFYQIHGLIQYWREQWRRQQ